MIVCDDSHCDFGWLGLVFVPNAFKPRATALVTVSSLTNAGLYKSDLDSYISAYPSAASFIPTGSAICRLCGYVRHHSVLLGLSSLQLVHHGGLLPLGVGTCPKISIETLRQGKLLFRLISRYDYSFLFFFPFSFNKLRSPPGSLSPKRWAQRNSLPLRTLFSGEHSWVIFSASSCAVPHCDSSQITCWGSAGLKLLAGKPPVLNHVSLFAFVIAFINMFVLMF